jgi:hypothetical protein
MLIRRQLDSKNHLHNTIAFIDSIDCDGVAVERDGNELKSFRKGKIYDRGRRSFLIKCSN